MKHKNSKIHFFITAALLTVGLFFSQTVHAEEKNCDDVRKNVISSCTTEKRKQPNLDPRKFSAIESTCNEEGDKEYRSCIGSSAAATECDKQKTANEEKCLKDALAKGLDLPNAKAMCFVKVDQAYKLCKDSTEGEFELPQGVDALNQFQGLTIQKVIGNIIATAMKILGSIAFAMMIFGGFMWMTAGGNSDRQRKAMDMMLWAALGVIVILSSYTIVKFVLDAFTN